MYDIIIIGAGPSGLAVAIEAKKAGMRYCIIEKGGIVNSIQHFPTAMTFFSTPELLEIGGVPFTSAQMRPTRAEGLEYYSRVAEHYALEVRFFEQVRSIRKNNGMFSVVTTKETCESKHVVLATGYYDHPNMLHVPGEELPKVSHYYSEPYPYYRQHVAVIGAKNSAAIAALELYRHGAHVTIIHRGSALSEKIKYWILPDLENRIKEGSITAYFNYTVTMIGTDSIEFTKEGSTIVLPNDFVFALTGYRPDFQFLESAGIALADGTNAPVHNPETFETNVRGLFVAGSVVAGKNNNQLFIENGRLHGVKIVEAIKRG
jgi:thioredoxin reductase (NADPH)